MFTFVALTNIKYSQNYAYANLNDVSVKHPYLGRGMGVFVATFDILSETLKPLAHCIERIAGVIINLLGVIFSKENCTIKDVLRNTQGAVESLILTGTSVLFCIPNFLCQLAYVLKDPAKVQRYNQF